jgi:hypothetical protein
MVSEEEIIITFLFKRSGKPKLSFSDLYLTLSMNLNWFTPEGAKEFVSFALKQKLLIKKGEAITPNFDYNKIVVPVGFTPSKMAFGEKEVKKRDEKEETVLNKIVKQLVEKTDLDKRQIVEKINATAKEKNISTEVAALLIGKEYNASLEDFFKEIEENIFTTKNFIIFFFNLIIGV